MEITPRHMEFCCDGTGIVSNLEAMISRIKSSGGGHHQSIH
jgi:hypothetical protein